MCSLTRRNHHPTDAKIIKFKKGLDPWTTSQIYWLKSTKRVFNDPCRIRNSRQQNQKESTSSSPKIRQPTAPPQPPHPGEALTRSWGPTHLHSPQPTAWRVAESSAAPTGAMASTRDRLSQPRSSQTWARGANRPRRQNRRGGVRHVM